MVLAFGAFELDAQRFELRRAGEPVHVEPKVFDVLLYLVSHRERVIPKTEILDHVWGDRFVTESALTTRVKAARRAVDDDGDRQAVIRTIVGRGYQFVAPVTKLDQDVPPPATVRRAQQIRYCRGADGVGLAYAETGQGPPLVKVANWMTHLDLEWTSPIWAHWLDELSVGRRLIRYDERGSGLSDWDVGPFTFDDWVDDLSTVIDASGLERVPLLGLSQGGAVAIAYAAANPERVSRLVLVGAYARGRMVRAVTREAKEEASLDIDLARLAWRREDDSFFQVFAAQFLPDASPDDRAEFIALQRATTSADNAGRFLDRFAHIDVSALASQVSCPTLVVHSRRDLRVPESEARDLAAAIPDSSLVLLDSGNHLLTEAEPAWAVFRSELTSFLGPDALVEHADDGAWSATVVPEQVPGDHGSDNE